MAKVFISYRRDDSAGHAGRVHDRLSAEFGRDLLFMDVDAIPLGADFVEVLGSEVARCEVLLAIIGPGWVEARTEDGSRRLDDEHDFVRIEIAAALTRKIPVIPILLEGTPMPRSDQLPADLKGLVRRNALDVRHGSFHADMDKLVRALKGNAAPKPAAPAVVTVSAADRYRAEGRIKIDAPVIHGAPDGWFLPGAGKTEWFADVEGGPEMVVVPAGSFTMGSPDEEPGRIGKDHETAKDGVFGAEEPRRTVTIGEPFAVGRHAVTRGQFAAFVAAAGHKLPDKLWTYELEGGKWEYKERSGRSWRNPGFVQGDDHPVVGVSWDDAKAYCAWLSKVTQKSYRLLSEAEWEYAARAEARTAFWWGNAITPVQANCDGTYDYAGGATGEWRKATVPVGRFEANPWGLLNVHGNVWEWCEDVFHGSYDGAPVDGRPWLDGGDVSRRVVRGASWNDGPQDLRSACRSGGTSEDRDDNLGFRLARTLNP